MNSHPLRNRYPIPVNTALEEIMVGKLLIHASLILVRRPKKSAVIRATSAERRFLVALSSSPFLMK